MNRVVLALVLAMVGLTVLPVAARQWTSRSGGFSVEAELLDVKDGNAILKKTDGTAMSVPLGKLSLGDIRYINEQLKAAEAGVIGKSEPTTEKPQPVSTPVEFKADKKTATSLKLQYAWKPGQTYIYHVQISADRGEYSDELSGDVTYHVVAVRVDGIELTVTGNMNRGTKTEPGKVVIATRPRASISGEGNPKSVTMTVDGRGHVIRVEGKTSLPYLLGELSQLMVEPLSDKDQSSWTIEEDTGVTVIAVRFPYLSTWPFGRRDDHPATQKTAYMIVGSSGNLVDITKHYELVTPATVSGKPRLEIKGDGTLKFDTQRGLPSSLLFEARIAVREKNRTEEIPLHITYRLLDEPETAQIAKAAEDAKRERERPLDEKDVAAALADLASSDSARVSRSTKLLAAKSPPKPDARITRALESAMLQGDRPEVRAAAAQALKNWSNAESIAALIQALSDSWPPVREAAIETLSKYNSQQAIGPIAERLADPFTRNTAARVLKTLGPLAEGPVLVHTESRDPWTRKEACEVLKTIGTKKSLPALKRAAQDTNHLVHQPAEEAIEAIQARDRLRSNAE